MGNIGLQLYSVRTMAEQGFLGTVRKVADMGYDAVQFAGFFETPADQVKNVLDEKGICVAGSHTPLDLLKGDKLKEAILYNQEIDNDLIICPYLPEEKRNSVESYKRTAEELNKIGQICKENGMIFGYHNHNFEFKNFDGITGFDLLFGNTDPDLVKIELDCFWAVHAGYDAKTIIEKYGDRVVSLHIKDMTEVSGEKKSVEIGSGMLDMNDLLSVAKSQHVDWLVVEQEDFDQDPMASAKINRDNLIDLLN
ncbi:sugar phosphate isomerase/epimerase family protein [Virgibacillus necropolis]|uniref:Sugar phosphate isomerase n=1 Tax=Virgibacillus necropolis TaxID=163877 RepID=A0A221MAC8_9BACI|nr:sugar phosphate isomerase/epimerase family protein [Virgibacillus necropolis]ASN04603.1 sugar phosphate isomerase [Virgibacillus necropolis]